MKHILPLILILFTCFAVQAQTITIEPDPISVSVDIEMAEGDVEGDALVHNNGNTTLNLIWERTILQKPDEWSIAVCDPNQCYLSSVETKDFVMEAGTEGDMIVHAYPSGYIGVTEGQVPGMAVVEIKVYEDGNETNFYTATYTLEVTGEVSTVTIEEEPIRLYPNPATEYFMVSDGSQQLDSIEIFSIVGKKMLSFAATDGEKYNIAGLPTGMYFARLFDADSNVLKTVRISKKAP